MLKDGRWAKDWDCCQVCKTTKRPHAAKGLCARCYSRRREYKQGSHCVDCGIETTERATRCYSCATKARWKRGEFCDRETKECSHKRTVAARAAWRCGAYDNRFTDDYRQKLSKATKAAWKRGDFDNEEWRRKQSEATKARWERGDMDDIFQSPTSIELQVAAALDIMGIEHTPQYRPEGYSCIFDEFVLPNILIEVQGDYWHGDQCPDNQRRDAEKAQWAKDNDFELIEIWEHEIKEQGAWSIIAQIYAQLKETRR